MAENHVQQEPENPDETKDWEEEKGRLTEQANEDPGETREWDKSKEE